MKQKNQQIINNAKTWFTNKKQLNKQLLIREKTTTRLITNTNKTKEKELVKEKKCLEKIKRENY